MYGYSRTLVLTVEYKPHHVIGWKEATRLMLNGKVEVVAEYNEVLATIGRCTLNAFPELKAALLRVVGSSVEEVTIRVPAVVVLKKPVGRRKNGVKFSRVNVLQRDMWKCQYCGKKFTSRELNYDHVKPRKQGGKTVWENIVSSCYPCNTRKADRTPEQAGMRLLSIPKKPRTLPLMGEEIDLDTSPDEWAFFLQGRS